MATAMEKWSDNDKRKYLPLFQTFQEGPPQQYDIETQALCGQLHIEDEEIANTQAYYMLQWNMADIGTNGGVREYTLRLDGILKRAVPDLSADDRKLIIRDQFTYNRGPHCQ